MLILIDHANVDAIAQTLTYLPIDGVTTNPTILFREGKEPLEVLHQIKEILPDGAQLHVQIVSERADDMVAEARALRGEIGGNLFIKLPVTREGFAAIPRIVREGMQVTATGIHSSMQGFMAAKAGARYVAPYVNRMDNYGIDGVRVASEIHRTLRSYGLGADVLAASFKNSEQVLELVRQGVGAITAAPDVLAALIKNPATDAAIADQNRDFGFLHPVVPCDPRREELAQFARIPPGALGQLHCDVRGPVAVLARPRALHLHDGQLALDRQSAVGDGGGKFVGDEPTEFFGCHARNSTRRLRHILANGPSREARTRS